MKVCPKCGFKYYNNLMTCVKCNCSTVDESEVDLAEIEKNKQKHMVKIDTHAQSENQTSKQNQIDTPTQNEKQTSKQNSPTVSVKTKTDAAGTMKTPTEDAWECIPKGNYNDSLAAKIMTIIAVLTWISGLILAISTASQNGDFNFILFLSIFVASVIVGCFCFCGAELLTNVQRIADSLDGYNVQKKKK